MSMDGKQGTKKEKEPAQKQSQQESAGKKEKKAKKDILIPPKKPKLSKAERRAKQEAQRAAKGLKADGSGNNKNGKKVAGGKDTGGESSVVNSNEKNSKLKKQKQNNDDDDKENQKSSSSDKTLKFFSHLPPFKDHQTNKDFSGIRLVPYSNSTSSCTGNVSVSDDINHNLHPAIIALGLQYADGTIRGANTRTIAMLQTFQTVLADYTFPTDTRIDYRHDLEHSILKPAFTYWTTRCRVHSVTMGNAFTFLKLAVANLDREMEEDQVKEILQDSMDAYMNERIEFAGQAIVKYASTKITNGDVILTYAKSDLIRMLLLSAREGKTFRVILVDSRPLLEAKTMVETLMDAGIECTYILLNSVSYVMKEVTKVFLGASALLSDGSALNRVGSAGVALMAKSHNVPVLICCETYKISSRVQLESITGNELGDPNELKCKNGSETGICSVPLLEDWRERDHLRLLNLLYDLTPSEFVSGIITEMGILPPTSVAVLLREMNPQESGLKSSGT